MRSDRRSIVKFLSTAIATGLARTAQAQTPSATDSDGRSQPWAPLELYMGGMFISVWVKGRRRQALLDTGATVTLVDRSFAAELGLNTSSGAVHAVTDRAAAAMAELLPFDLEVDQLKLTIRGAACVDLSSVSEGYGRVVPLAIGQDLFRNRVVDLDLPNRRYSLRSAHFQLGSHGTAMTLGRGEAGARTIEVALEGRAPIQAVVDLGSDSPLMISSAYADRQGLLNGKRTSTAAIAQVTGVEISETSSLSDVAIGPYHLKSVPCDVLPDWRSSTTLANLGLPIFGRFRLLLDYDHDRITLAPDDKALAQPFERDLTGLGLAVLPDRLHVVHVARNGPAEAGGWREADEIVAVNGHPITSDYVGSGLSRWRYGALGSEVTLTLADGSRRVLRLQTYY